MAWLAILTVLPAAIQSQSLLWKVSGKHLKKPSYLFGTMHMGDERITQFNPATKAAFAESKTLALELELDKVNAFEAMKYMMMDSLTLQDLFSPEDYAFLDAYFRDSLDQNLNLYKKFKPFFLYSVLMEAQLRHAGGDAESAITEKGADMKLLKEAREAGKHVVGLETLQEQMQAIDSWELKDQAQYIIQSLKDDLSGEEMKSMNHLTELYIAGDLNGMMKLSEASGTGPEFEKNLVEKRNLVMVERMMPLFKKGPAFIAVGALHLPGEKGIISLLRAEGFVVEAVQ